MHPLCWAYRFIEIILVVFLAYHKKNIYIDKVLSTFGMKDCTLEDTPIAKGDKFNLLQCPKNEIEKKEMENIPYASTVGSLMYAQACTHLDIAYVVGMLGRYLSNLRMIHWKVAKWVIRYL